MSGSFTLSRLPRIVFGDGSLSRLPELVRSFGTRALLVTGRRSFRESGRWPALVGALEDRGMSWQSLAVATEPTPALVDEAVEKFRGERIEVVVAVGGGSALDAGKAVAGLLPRGNSVLDHLEGVGRGIAYHGPSTPFIAVPTTAGTGSEATKNAVLSRRGRGGFKRSFRHECLVARYAVVDPTLLESCPPELIAADGMDALTQLVESYVSARANPLTDALALSGLRGVRRSLLPWYEGAGSTEGLRREMAYAALVSGITLAQAGLGAVHGLASPLGALFPIPHGVACGTLLAATTRVNLRALEQREPAHPHLARYAELGRLLAGSASEDPRQDHAALLELLATWTERLRLPRLRDYGVTDADLPDIVAASRGGSMETNPILLRDEELRDVLRARL